MILITYNADLGDAWEWMDYPSKFTTYAYRLCEFHRLCHESLNRLTGF
jgi:hypothetical protein